MAKTKRTKTAPAPLPPVVKVKINAPKETESAEMTVLADDLLAAGVVFPATIGTSPFLAPMKTENAAVKLQIPIAKDGSVSAKATLLTQTRTLKGSIMGHGGWLSSQMINMSAADASAYAVNAGVTTAKQGTHPSIAGMGVKNGPVGSLLLIAEFPHPAGRCLSCVEYCTDGKTWLRGNDTELSHVNLPSVFTAGQIVQVRLRMFMRGTGYTNWAEFTITVA